MACSDPTCDRPARARGMCHRHYQRWRGTSPVPDADRRPPGPPPSRCTIPDCGLEHSARGLCSKHYQRWLSKGSTDLQPYSYRRRMHGKPGTIYVIGERSRGPVKIGCTSNLRRRLTSLQDGTWRRLVLLASFDVPDMGRTEMAIHYLLANHRVRGEWFRVDRSDLASMVERWQTEMF